MKLTTVLSTVTALFAAKTYAMSWEEADVKAREWCADLSNEEKIILTTGSENMMGACAGAIAPIKRKGFRGLCLQDGPAGVRPSGKSSTTWQAAINTASTFDRELFEKVGAAQGSEFYAKGINVALAPAMNIQRSPAAGRIWECYGEDPFLAGTAAAGVIKGFQSQGVMTTAKHYVANDQENNRGASSSNVDEQALWEIYIEPFYRAIKDGGATGVMSGYNGVNGTYMVQNKKLLTDYLKKKIGFNGFVVSDWMSIYDLEKTFPSGMDMNMPGGKFWGPDFLNDSFWGSNIQKGIEEGTVEQERLDDAALRVVRALFKTGQMEDKDFPTLDITRNTITKENIALNRKVAADSSVLLKNDDAILPITKKIKKIAIIGRDADQPNECPISMTGAQMNGCADGTLVIGWGSGTTEISKVADPLSSISERAKKEGIEIVSYPKDDAKAAAKAAEDADLVLVFVQADSGEEMVEVEGCRGDRLDLDLWHKGNELVEAVSKVNENTVVVIHAPGPVNLPFKDDVKGILYAGMPGMESGNALVDVLFGDVNPSGHLPFTWAKREDYCCDVMYEETKDSGIPEMQQYDYNEGLYVGYRWFDKKNIDPTYAFGYGLSYTTFEYSNMDAVMEEDGLHVTLTVTNTGDVDGAAVPMIFLSFPDVVKDYPALVFKGFDKMMLKAGESKETTIIIDNHDLSYYDVKKADFVKPSTGSYTVYAGANERDLSVKAVVGAAVGSAAEDISNDSNAENDELSGADDVEAVEDDDEVQSADDDEVEAADDDDEAESNEEVEAAGETSEVKRDTTSGDEEASGDDDDDDDDDEESDDDDEAAAAENKPKRKCIVKPSKSEL